jgi:hypothetical protein
MLGKRLDLRPEIGHRHALGDDAPRQGGRIRDIGATPKAVAAKPAKLSETEAASVFG